MESIQFQKFRRIEIFHVLLTALIVFLLKIPNRQYKTISNIKENKGNDLTNALGFLIYTSSHKSIILSVLES